MHTSTLACGPIFTAEGLVISIVILLGFKPLAYYAFIRPFRYCVSQPISMTVRQAATLTGLRAGLGFVLVRGRGVFLQPIGFALGVLMGRPVLGASAALGGPGMARACAGGELWVGRFQAPRRTPRLSGSCTKLAGAMRPRPASRPTRCARNAATT